MSSQQKCRKGRSVGGYWLLALICLASSAQAVSVGPTGYTNAFDAAAPGPSDWSTATVAGGAADVTTASGLDSAVQALGASGIATQIPSDTGNPPAANALATWSSSGHYLQTRPTGVKMAVVMATLVNDTGTDANVLNISYDFTAATSVAEEIPGPRVYYSLTGAANSWQTIPALNSPPGGRVNANVVLSSTWNTGTTLYLLWADDNGSGSPDNANQIDNVFISATFTNLPLTIALTTPLPGQHFGSGSTISAGLALTGSPTNVSYYLDGSLVVARTASPFTPVVLPSQSIGSHTIYATAQDRVAFVSTATNSFAIDSSLSGTLTADTTLYASNSPCLISGDLTVADGATLAIEPGTTVQLAANVHLIMNGRIEAVGTAEKRIRFTHSSASDWGGISFTGNHKTNIFAFVDFEYASGSGNGGSAVIYINDSQVSFERDTFLKMSGHKYMDIWYPQVAIRHSVFGDVGASYMFTVENLAPNGWFIVDGNLFGLNTGDNDIFHLNHISVKDGPKAVLVNNVFTGAGDDHIDDNESDSHIEGNLFMNFTTNHPPRSASCAVTTGEGSGVSTNLHTQRLIVVRNVFWGCDYGIINKDGSALEVYNCIFMNNRGGIIFDEPWRTDSGPGRSCYIEGCIFWDNWPENGLDQGTFAYITNSAAYTTGRYYRGATQVTVNHSILPSQYHYLGTGNVDGNPMFTWPTNLMNLSPTNPAFAGGFDGFDANAFLFTNQLIPDLHLLAGSPALGSGFNTADMGIYVADDATISGEPASPTTNATAALTVGGLDINGYKYRLIGPAFTNAWSQEIQPWCYVPAIVLSGTTATATCTGHGFADGDTIEIRGADSLCPYYNGFFVIRDAAADSFSFTVSPGTNLFTSEPLSITWPIRNEGRTDIWCRKPQNIELSGLADGTYRVEVIRKNSMDVWQDTNNPSVSRVWTVMTNPLKISSAFFETNTVTLKFNGLAGQSYTVEYSDTLSPSNWNPLIHLPALITDGEQTVRDDSVSGRSRFYRVRMP